MTVGYCNQAFLDVNFPGEVCNTTEEADSIASQMDFIFVYMDQYIDVADFVQPIKYNINGFA